MAIKNKDKYNLVKELCIQDISTDDYFALVVTNLKWEELFATSKCTTLIGALHELQIWLEEETEE